MAHSTIQRYTRETKIFLKFESEGRGKAEVDTGIPFFNHMLELFAHHGRFDLNIRAEGDIAVDYHHTVEDLGICLGQAVHQALGKREGIVRYGFFLLPMDECLTQAVVDLGGRAFLRYDAVASETWVRDFNIGLLKEFFQAFVNHAAANVHIRLHYGEEPHHIAEGIFKAFARALDAACKKDPRLEGSLPSTKGLI